MSARMKALFGAAALVALASPALAQDASPWDLRERNAYVLDMQGKMWSMRVSNAGAQMIMRKAKAVPRGTVLFMQDGRMYMARAGLWDGTGKFMITGGGY